MNRTRPSWDEYFMQIAKDVASRSTCNRASVGAVVVKDHRILSTGYNGSLPGEPHCIDAGCKMVDGHCERTVHAETNAVVQAAKFGISLNGATMYVWMQRFTEVNGYHSLAENSVNCIKCDQVIKSAGIVRVICKMSSADYEERQAKIRQIGRL